MYLNTRVKLVETQLTFDLKDWKITVNTNLLMYETNREGFFFFYNVNRL